MTKEVQYELGLYVNTGDRTVDIVKSSYKDDDDDFGEDTVIKTIPWIEGYTYEEQMKLMLYLQEKGYYSFIEVN